MCHPHRNNDPSAFWFCAWSSSPGEFHPEALTDPCVNLSIHTALHSRSLLSVENKPFPEERAHPGIQLAEPSVELCHPLVESRCGAVVLGLAYLLPVLSFAGASLSEPCPVSTSRSSNWTGAFNASSSRRKYHDFAHEKSRVRSVSRTKPNLSCRVASEYFRVVSLASLCLPRSH